MSSVLSNTALGGYDDGGERDTGVVGTLEVGSHQFPYRRIDLEPVRWEGLPSRYSIDTETPDVDVEITRTGQEADGPWGVEIWSYGTGARSVEQARVLSAALAGAAALCDVLNSADGR